MQHELARMCAIQVWVEENISTIIEVNQLLQLTVIIMIFILLSTKQNNRLSTNNQNCYIQIFKFQPYV